MVKNIKHCPEKLLKQKDNLQKIDALSQSINYNISSWNKYFKNDKEFKIISGKYKSQISREDIALLSRQAADSKKSNLIKIVFLSTMMWGFGTVGYGPYRTSRMLKHKNSIDILKKTFSLIFSGEITEAYDNFHLPMCGPAFFTKFFYFIGLGSKLKIMPLILDSIVALSIEEYLELPISKFAKVVRNKDNKIISVKRNSEGYKYYFEQMNIWARYLNCSPDSIEYYLFNRTIASAV